VAYEIKVILKMISAILRRAKNREEAHEALIEIANVEGVILKPLD